MQHVVHPARDVPVFEVYTSVSSSFSPPDVEDAVSFLSAAGRHWVPDQASAPRWVATRFDSFCSSHERD